MAGRQRSDRGGILSLWDLHEEHPEAIEHEFIVLGVRWRDVGTRRLSWRDAKIIIQQSPASGALARAMHPEHHEYFHRALEMVLHEIRTLQVLFGNQSGAKRSDFPRPPEWAQEKNTISGADNALPINDLLDFFAGDFVDRVEEPV